MPSDAQILAPPAGGGEGADPRRWVTLIILLRAAGYTLAYALVLITGGRLGDIFGRRRLFLIGVAGFTVMSALCGAARGPGMLIACRVAQGALGAVMVPQVLAVIQVIFPPAERIKALAGFGVTAGLGTVSGRELAERLQVARNTVLVAYDRLAGEGFVTGKVGAGTFVTGALSARRIVV